MAYKTIEELEVYQLAEQIADIIWKFVIEWDYFTKDTIGKQLTRAADSISANIAEGHGRYHFKDNKNFCYYSRGSIIETKSWLLKCKKRELISNALYSELMQLLETTHIKLNAYIKQIGS